MATLLEADGMTGQAAAFYLPVGSNGKAGDLRLVRLTVSYAGVFDPPPSGWTAIHDEVVSGSGRVGMWARWLQGGDADGVLYLNGTSYFDRQVITVRGADPAADLAPATAGSSSASTSLVAPSVPTGVGTLLTFHTVTRSSGANTTTFTTPAGMTRQAVASSARSADYVALLCSEARISGASGTRTAIASGSGTWRATSLFVPDAPAPPAGPEPGRALLAT